jgi:hypothetical protein
MEKREGEEEGGGRREREEEGEGEWHTSNRKRAAGNLRDRAGSHLLVILLGVEPEAGSAEIPGYFFHPGFC